MAPLNNLNKTTNKAEVEGAIRVLLTGFGPFKGLPTNPSWTAVKQLHNVLIPAPSSSNDTTNPNSTNRPIHFTCFEIPTIYTTVLQTIPNLYTSPPSLPPFAQPSSAQPPEGGYDFIMHVGLAGNHVLRLEKLAHKYGFTSKDVKGEVGPVVDDTIDPPLRGFGDGYEGFEESMESGVDVEGVVGRLVGDGVQIYTSYDPGRYLCDFIYYCSLAHSRLAALSQGKEKGEAKPVLFLHVSPVGEPTSTEEVVDGIVRITKDVVW